MAYDFSMRPHSLALLCLLTLATSAFAKDEWVTIAGTVSNFRTDVRVLNPSFDKDISVTATFLPVGNADNSDKTGVAFTIPKRQMKMLDDVVGTLFSTTGIGAIRFSSADDFEVTSRIYATVAAGTLGQFSPGLMPGAANAKGALLQLKSGTAFRTNVGAVNPSASAASVTWRLYDKNNAVVATGTPIAMPPFAVIGPTNIAGSFFFNPGTADLSDCWMSYTSDQPIFAYSSVIDSGTTDPTFIPAVPDTGVAPTTTQPQTKTFEVTLHSFHIDITPAVKLAVGDTATFHIRGNDTTHGFVVVGPKGDILIDPLQLSPGSEATRSFKVTTTGTHSYFCVVTTCGEGHNSMVGSFDVGKETDDPGHGY